jgi:predicted PurR-regulated permease PerM
MSDQIPQNGPNDPRVFIRTWLPHVALIALIAGAAWWLWLIIAPARSALMLAASLALLTYPLIFLPVDETIKKTFPALDNEFRRYISALSATVILASALLTLMLSTLIAIVGNWHHTLQLIIGIALQEAQAKQQALSIIIDRLNLIAQMFPSLALDVPSFRPAIESLLGDVSVVPAFLHYLITGTGGLLAKTALTLVTLFYLYSQGPRLVTLLFDYLPLNPKQRDHITERFHNMAVHLLTGTLARAATHGAVLGLLAWLIGGFNPLIVALGAGFIALLPVAGPSVAWIPLASVLWSQQHIPSAIALGCAALASSFIIERLAVRLASYLGTDDLWLSFLLFLAIVGGFIGFGPLGLILGPAAVLTFSILMQVIPALYGREE